MLCGVVELILWKGLSYQKQSTDLAQCPLKSQFNSSQILKKNLKIYMGAQRPRTPKTIQNNKLIARDITIPDSKLF